MSGANDYGSAVACYRFSKMKRCYTLRNGRTRRCSAGGTGAFARLARDRARMLFPCVKAVASDRTHIDLVGGGRWEAQYARWRRAVVVLTGVSGADCSAVFLFANGRTPA